MLIGYGLRAVREAKGLSQGDVGKRSGMKHALISRIENDHVVPAIESRQKLGHSLDVPLYQLFYDRQIPAALSQRNSERGTFWGSSGKDARTLGRGQGIPGGTGIGRDGRYCLLTLT